LSRAQGIAIIAVAFVISRLAYATAGIRFDYSALTPRVPSQVQWQLLDLRLLRHDLISSIWYLHSQPPLYNVFCGILLHLPTGAQQPVAAAVFLALGMAMVGATFLLLLEFDVATWLATAISLAVVADPAMVLYENWLSWSYPTAALLTVGCYSVVRLVRTGAARWAVISSACLSAVVLLDSTFQWPWLVAVFFVVGVAVRRQWRRVACAAAVPLLVVAGWYAKDVALFGTDTTSSWLGMNLSHTTVAHAPGRVRKLVQEGRLSAIAEVPAFSPLDSYVPRFVSAKHAGVPALDEQKVSLGVPNFNNLAYVAVSHEYLHADISYIVADPNAYLDTLPLTAKVWALPADQYFTLEGNYGEIAGYARVFDSGVLLQPQFAGGNAGKSALLAGRNPPFGELSWTVVLITAAALLLAPFDIANRFRRRLPWAGSAVLWLTVGYGFAVTSLTELGENMRFQFQLGTLPLVVAVVAVSALVSRRRRSGASAS